MVSISTTLGQLNKIQTQETTLSALVLSLELLLMLPPSPLALFGELTLMRSFNTPSVFSSIPVISLGQTSMLSTGDLFWIESYLHSRLIRTPTVISTGFSLLRMVRDTSSLQDSQILRQLVQAMVTIMFNSMVMVSF